MWGRGDDDSAGKLWVVEASGIGFELSPLTTSRCGSTHMESHCFNCKIRGIFFSQYSIVMKYISLCPDLPWMLGFSLRYS